MKIETGCSLLGTVEPVRSESVRFVAEDGRTMFEVRACKNGRTIEIRGVDCCFVGGNPYGTTLEIQPVVSNCIRVSAKPYY